MLKATHSDNEGNEPTYNNANATPVYSSINVSPAGRIFSRQRETGMTSSNCPGVLSVT